jgi:protocatechuate 3,4-dioxygenase beta subunit
MDARTRFAVVVLTALAVVAGVFFAKKTDRDTDEADSTTIGRLAHNRRSGGNAQRVRADKSRKPAERPTTSAAIDTAHAAATTSVSIVGTIADESGKALEGAKFTVRTVDDSFNKSFTTDKSGHFAAEGITPGTYDLLAGHTNFVTMMRPSFTAVPGSGQYIVDFKLPIGTKVIGTVADEAGKPLQNVRVAVRNNTTRQSQADGSFIQDDTTYKVQMSAKSGEFSVAGIGLGQNLFEFSRAGYEQEQRKVDVQAATAGQPLKIVLRKTGLMAGVVVDEEGKPVSTATVHLIRYKPIKGEEERIDKGAVTAVSGMDGKFKFTKLYNEGFYDLQVEDQRFAPGIYPLVAVGNERVVCALEKGGTIEGSAKFIDRATTPAAILVSAQTVI